MPTNLIDQFASRLNSCLDELEDFKKSLVDIKFELLPYANNVLRNIGQTIDFSNSLLFTDLNVDSVEVVYNNLCFNFYFF